MNTKENIPMLVIESVQHMVLGGGWEARVTLGFIGGGPTENPPFLDIDHTQGLERVPLAGDIVWVRPPQVVGFLDEKFSEEAPDVETEDEVIKSGPPWPGSWMPPSLEAMHEARTCDCAPVGELGGLDCSHGKEVQL